MEHTELIPYSRGLLKALDAQGEGGKSGPMRRDVRIALFCLAFCAVPAQAQADSGKSPDWAGFLAEWVPGAGYAYEGRWAAAGLSAGLALPMAGFYYQGGLSYPASQTVTTIFTLADFANSYTVFDTYQSALDDLGRPPQLIDIPHYSIGELYLSPFDAGVYKSWKVWAGLGISVGGMIYELASSPTGVASNLTPASILILCPLIFAETMWVALGEESEYRGFQFPAFSKLTGSKWLGAALSSLSFGAAHLGLSIQSPYVLQPLFHATSDWTPYSAVRITPFDVLHAAYTMGYGLYASWLTASEPDGLKKAIAVHAIGDGLFFLGQFLAQGHAPALGFSVTMPLAL